MEFKQLPSAFLLMMASGCGTALAASNAPELFIMQQADKITVQGTVVDATGEPLIGVSVLELGTTNGAITDIDGKFSLSVASGSKLELSYIGYKSIQVEAKADLGVITLSEDTEVLEEVVVTALGIKREKKALGYAMQEVKGESLVASREANIANALSGKIAGVQITRSSNGPGGSSKIQLRGANSVTGMNQPLIVVDGVPMDNFTGSDNADFYNPSLDMGNGLSDINPEDIESMSVLKGASAAALYGSRAGNGVILITTKKGTKREGLGITVSASVSAETIFMKPNMQKSFGQGTNGAYNQEAGTSWGPAMGSEYTFNGQNRVMQYFDNIDSYFNVLTNLTERESFQQQFDKTAVYASATRMDDSSKIPGAKLDRTNFTLRASSTFGKDDRWSFDGKIQYINTGAENRPLLGKNDSNAFLANYQLPASLDIRDFSNPLDEDGNMYWWSPKGLNPYWLEKYNLNEDSRSRFLLNASLKYKFTDWLNLELRAGSDMYFTESTAKVYAGAKNLNNGNSSYELNEQRFYENNFSFLLSAQKDNLIDKIGVTATFGGNLMERKSTGLKNRAGLLTVPNLFNINNSSNADRTVTETYSHRKINSLYGTLGLNYNGWIFLDATFRNDWSSTLSKENRSFFYPSVSLSWVITDMLNKIEKPLPEWVTYAKARASFAQVGNDMDPYQLYNSCEIGSDRWGNTTAKPGDTKYDATVRSELISSWEAGLEMKFFNNRLGFDLAWYKSNAERQLMKVPMNEMSGFKNKIINAGNIQNSGIELMINARPVETADFSWDTQINFSKNNNKVLELGPGIPKYELGGAAELKVYAVAGGNYGEIWGTRFARVEDVNSPYYGKLILNDAGLPTTDGQIYKIGDQQPDCMLGWNNTFSYKGFTLGFQIDGRLGGDIYSYTNYSLQVNGRAEVTAPNGARDKFVVDGVIADGNGGYKVNTIEVTPQQYWSKGIGTGNTGIGEANIYDGTNIRLRNVSLNYSFPREMLKKTCFQQVKMGVSVNNVWMIYSDMEGIDPESVMVANTNATGFEFGASPTSRSYLFNVTLGF